VSSKIIMTMSVTRLCFTTQHKTCKTKTKITVCKTKAKTDFLVSDQSCPKTDSLRPHHWLPSSIIWYRPMGGDVWRLGRYSRAWPKVIAAYRRVYGFGHLQADCRGPGSALEPYIHFEFANTVNHYMPPEYSAS